MTFCRLITHAYPLFLILTLSACGDAIAIDQSKTDLKIKPVTRAECLATEVKQDKIACFNQLAKQRKNELEATEKRIEDIRKESAKLKKENEALLKEFEKGVLKED